MNTRQIGNLEFDFLRGSCFWFLISGKHFYIYEPTQLLNGSLVISIFFYLAHGELYAKCIRQRTTGVVSKDNVKLLIPKYLPCRSELLFSVKCSEFVSLRDTPQYPKACIKVLYLL
ncbi:uncharacterized protein VP01_4328g1 [Puccinia sorghi]|uniref:Uncharacterized protein n=1 Tax=Puccinia sorghi TaxID=27349 RepID=A0A0L6UPZ5_9BASI|nr:uncharacterized protein VP01_4328g1 [Puccinia sorghi]